MALVVRRPAAVRHRQRGVRDLRADRDLHRGAAGRLLRVDHQQGGAGAAPRRSTPASEELIGAHGVVRSPLDPVGHVFVQGRAVASAPAERRATRRSATRSWSSSVDGLTLTVAPADPRPDGPAEGVQSATWPPLLIDPRRPRLLRRDRARERGPGAAGVRARRDLPARPPDRPEGPGPDPPDPDHRQDGAGRPAHGDAQHPAAGGDHARQRAGLGERRLLLPRRERERRDRAGRELPAGDVADRADDAARGARPRRAGHAAVRARPPERRAAADHRRADRALGHQGHDGRDQGRRDPADDAARDGAPGRGRARAAREDHRRRGRVPGLRQARAGRRRRSASTRSRSSCASSRR